MSSLGNNSWSKTSFASVVKRLVNGGTPSTEIETYWRGSIPWVTGADFTPSGITSFRRFISEEAVAKTSTNLIDEGELLIVTRTGVGKVTIAPCDIAISQDITGVYLDRNQTDTRFMYYEMQRGIENLKRLNQGTSINGLPRSDLLKYPLNLPPLLEQWRIAEILSTVDEAIAQTEALIKKTQQIKAGLMHDLFTRGVTPDGQLRPPRHEAPHLYKQSAIGWIPKDWEIRTTADCAVQSPGSTTIGPFGSNLIASDYRSEGVPVIFVRDVKEDSFEWNSNVYVSPEKALSLSAHGVKPGDIVATKMGLPACVACTYPEWMPSGIVTADIIRLRPNTTSVDVRWLSAALNNEMVRRQVQAITAGVTRPKVTLADFRTLKLACPALEEQIAVGERLVAINERINIEFTSWQNLAMQKKGLMHDLLTGKVRVSAIETTETKETNLNV